MSAFTLKLIALVTMIIDHVGAIFLPAVYLACAISGGFPCRSTRFLLVQGYMHTRNF